MNKRLLLFALVLAEGLLASCGGSSDREGAFQSVPPAKLTALGVPLSAYVVTSIDPGRKFSLTLDRATNRFTGSVEVPTGETFDLTVVYEAEEPDGELVQIAHYIRRGLVASGSSMDVKYQGDEQNWQTLFDLTPGVPNDLNLDGDAYNNLIEVGYGSDPRSTESLPRGARVSGSRDDPLGVNPSVGLPPSGSDPIAALRGEVELILEAETPFDLKSMEVVSPHYGFELLSTNFDDKQLKIKLNTLRFVAGPNVGQISLTVRVTDEFDIVRDTILTFAAYNPIDNLGPAILESGLTADQIIRDKLSFGLEANDPSGISSVSVLLRNQDNPFTVTVPLTDQDSSTTRFSASVDYLVTDLPDGAYQVELVVADSLGNTDRKTVPVRLQNSAPVTVFGAVARLLLDSSPTSGPVAETAALQLDASLCDGPFDSQSKIYSWLCSDSSGFNFSGLGSIVSLTPPNVTAAQRSRRVSCVLTFTNGNFRDQAQVDFDVTVVNNPPSISGVTFSPTNGSAIQPQNFTIGWTISDPDGDRLTSTVALTPEGNSSPTITCSNISGSFLEGGSTTNCSLSLVDRKTYGELASPLTLAARTRYTVTVTTSDNISPVSASTSGIVTDDNLIGWWRLDEGSGTTTEDSSGNGNNGTLIGSPDWADGSLQFDGVNDYVEIPDNPLWNFGSGDFAIELWANFSDLAAIHNLIGQSNGGGSQDKWGIGYNYPLTGGIGFHMQGSIAEDLGATASLSTGEWHQIVLVRDRDRWEFYLDGEKISSEFFTGSVPNSTSTLKIGVDGELWRYFQGSLDEIAIYNRALTVDEIRQSCRRTSSSVASGEGGCPDPREPIILTPLPNQVLPPTRAYWSWRGERGREGELLYDDLEYSVTFKELRQGIFPWIGPIDRGKTTTGYLIEPFNPATQFDTDFELKVTATQGSQTFDFTRLFSTDNSVVGWWSFDEVSGTGVGDLSGNSPLNQGSLYGPLSSSRWRNDGILETALRFNGQENY
ncbi:MAG: LamG domain-containing protein, partial [Deltaproteobacteria bacterium]|nr:LamG domain-containing protein [Deltaproteobacteria bacterium]